MVVISSGMIMFWEKYYKTAKSKYYHKTVSH